MRMGMRYNSERATSLLARAASWSEYGCLGDLSAQVLQDVSTNQGIDFATALLFDRIVRSPIHGPFIRRVDQLRQAPWQGSTNVKPLLAVVPGAFYVEHPDTGADGRVLRAEAIDLGWRAELIPTASLGVPAENGRLILAWLSERPEENIVVASLSKGGADVKMALSARDTKRGFRKVRAWINFSGTLDGSPMVAWLLGKRCLSAFYRLLFWLRGRDFGCIRDLDRRAGCALDFPLRAPENLKMIHVAGFPMREHVSTGRARRWHRRLAQWGPNDSAIILSDVCRLPGLILPVWGTDHYFQPGWDPRSLVRAIFRYVSDELNLSKMHKPKESLAQ